MGCLQNLDAIENPGRIIVVGCTSPNFAKVSAHSGIATLQRGMQWWIYSTKWCL